MTTSHFLVLFTAVVLDRCFGDPKALWRTLPHPVVLMGHSITWCDRRWNTGDRSAKARKRLGLFALVVLILLWVGGAALTLHILPPWLQMVITCLTGTVLIAHHSLAAHVTAVAHALETDGVAAGRDAVRHIVGRQTTSLDTAGICRAAIESTAENFSDGVVAPVLWFCVGGVPGLILYKLVNTADSMIGHRSELYRDFGWASARLDDLLNWPASRLSALLLTAAARWHADTNPRHATRVWQRDARHHKSPNAGHPESAMAGALGVALAGPRQYGTDMVHDPYLNAEGRMEATPQDILRAVKLINTAWLYLPGGLLLAAVAVWV